MRVRRFAPRLKGVCLDGELILGRDDILRLELLGHSLDGLIFVTHVVLFQIFHVLCFNGRDNGFDHHVIYHFL